jgi:hypothetical protein
MSFINLLNETFSKIGNFLKKIHWAHLMAFDNLTAFRTLGNIHIYILIFKNFLIQTSLAANMLLITENHWETYFLAIL